MTHPTILYNTTDRFNLSYVYRLSIICTYRYRLVVSPSSDYSFRIRRQATVLYIYNLYIHNKCSYEKQKNCGVKTQVKLDFNETVSRDLYTFFFQIHYICVLSWPLCLQLDYQRPRRKKKKKKKWLKNLVQQETEPHIVSEITYSVRTGQNV